MEDDGGLEQGGRKNGRWAHLGYASEIESTGITDWLWEVRGRRESRMMPRSGGLSNRATDADSY